MLSSQNLLTGFGVGNSPNLASLNAFSQSPSGLSATAFQDLLSYFVTLEQTSQTLAQQQASLDDSELAGLPPLLSAPLHLDISVEGFRHLSAAEVAGLDPTNMETLQTEDGLASRITLVAPELASDGTVTYTLTLVKMALRLADPTVSGDVLGTAIGTALGQISMAGAAASGGDALTDFLDQGWNGGTSIWHFQTDDAQSWVANPQDQSKMLQELLDMAYSLMQYLNNLEILRAFQMSKEEKKRIEEAIKAAEMAAEKEAKLRDMRKKQRAEDALLQELIKRHLMDSDAQKQANAEALRQRLVHFFSQTQHILNQGNLNPGQLSDLIGECYRLDLEMRAALAAQTMARTGSAH